MAMSFLTTRVSNRDVDDWGKLRRTLRFFHCNLKEKICCGATKIDKVCTWLYASYTVHRDMKSHNGCLMSIGLGVTNCRLSKKKFNMKIPIDAELVGTSGYVPYNIWYIMFIHHQGYLNNSKNNSVKPKCHEDISEWEELFHRKLVAY